MKLENSNNSELKTNVTNEESHDFAIGDVSTIIEILRNRLYSNPIQTLTQEYLSNARDSHREAKQTKPIRVTLPTKIESCLKIRDYGVGLSKERVKQVFVNYGISTKRSDNVQTGGFGLGAKSAWAYTDSFVVVSYYNGICSTYVAHTGKNKNGTFELINEASTTEENGVEVQIPIKEADINKFINAVYRTTFFWDQRPELLGITKIEIPNEFSYPEIVFSDKNISIIKNSEFTKLIFSNQWNSIFILIDKIPYEVSRLVHQVPKLKNILDIINKENTCFIEVQNGDVEVSASREEVSNDQKNINKIESICISNLNQISNNIANTFNQKFENLREYKEKYSELNSVFVLGGLPNVKSLPLTYSLHECNFKFNLSNAFTCDKFYQIEKYSIKTKHSTEGEKEFIRCEEKEFIPIDAKIIIQDKPFSDIIKKRKAKKIISEKNEVYLVTTDDQYLDFIKNSCDGTLLSTIVHDKINYNKKAKLENEVKIRKLAAKYSFKRKVEVDAIETIKLSDIASQDLLFIVVPFSSEEKFDFDNQKFYQTIDFFSKNKSVVIKCSKKDYEKIIELENVVKYEDVMSNIEAYFPISDERIERHFHNHISENLLVFRKYKNKIKCSVFKRLFEFYPNNLETRTKRTHSDISVDISIIKEYAHYKIAEQKFKEINKIENKINKRYPLLKNNFYYDRENTTKELIYYINSKARMRKIKILKKRIQKKGQA